MGSYEGYQLIISVWVIFALSTLCVAARLYVQLRFRVRPWREVFVVMAWILYLGLAIVLSIMNDLNFFHYQGWTLDTHEQVVTVYKVHDFAQGIFYITSLYCSLASLLCFYFDLAPRRLYPKTWHAIFATSIFVGCSVAYSITYFFIRCWPISRDWSFKSEDIYACSMSPSRKIKFMIYQALQLSSDILVITIPFFLLHYNLKGLSWKARAGTAAMFAIAFFEVIMVAIQTGFNAWYLSGNQQQRIDLGSEHWYAAQEWLYSVQPGTMIMIICAPYIRRLWNGTSAEAMRRGSRTSPVEDIGGSSRVEKGMNVNGEELRLKLVPSSVSS